MSNDASEIAGRGAVEGPAGRVTIDEIVDALLDEAARIETTQAALVSTRARAAPDAREMRTRLLFETAADMLIRLKPHQKQIRTMLAR